jgi:phosphoribosyl 1,2-cyclic phosphate phosphodiesterase
LARLTILGCGTSTGVPQLGCGCSVCVSPNPKNKRTRTSALLELPHGKKLLFDASPDFRQQMLREKHDQIDGILFTHMHADHTHGLDDLRAVYFKHMKPIPCWMEADHTAEFQTRFSYFFDHSSYEGTPVPIQVRVLGDDAGALRKLLPKDSPELDTLRLPHGQLTKVTAFRFGSFAYATDFSRFPSETRSRWRGRVDTMIASGLRWEPHDTHSTIASTLELMEDLEVKRGIITHMSHAVDYAQAQQRLPPWAELAWDGMKIDFAWE